MQPLRFGLFVPQHDVPAPALRGLAEQAEALGFDSLWVYDHLQDYPSPAQPAVLEALALLGVLAGWTTRLRLGSLVLCDAYRNPALTAKAAASLDALSGGRLEFGYGAGWHEAEHRAYGFDFAAPALRIARMEEGLQIIKALWQGEAVSFAGAHHQVREALCLPRPAQRPHPPITIGGGGERLLLRAVARHADMWNYFSIPLVEYERKRAVLHAHCAAIGRDPATMAQSLMVPLVTAWREKEVRDQLEAARQRGGVFQSDDQLVQGTPDIVVPRLLDYARRGVSLFIFVLPDPLDAAQVAFVAEEVAQGMRDF
ncbi:MAG: TIGR03560 family F420-dependent LLM class oxidoreductase [bacterium]